jgi:hypothetical protein
MSQRGPAVATLLNSAYRGGAARAAQSDPLVMSPNRCIFRERTMSDSAWAAAHHALETASWLSTRCPVSARAYAVAMHEIAAWGYDDDAIEHWRKVLALLPK